MTGSPDVASTLGELERKLKDLERELATAAEPAPAPAPAPAAPGLAAVPPLAPAPAPAQHDVVISPPAPAAAPEPSTAQLIAEAHETFGSLHLQVAQLVQFRERLERSAHELVDEYSRMLEAIQAAAPRAAAPAVPPPGPAAAPPAPAVTPAPAAAEPAPVAPAPPAAPPAPVSTLPPTHVRTGPGAEDQRTYSGAVTVEAGPFADIATLSSFEQALGHLPGAQDVYVRGFEGDRALIDLVLGSPIAVGEELRHTVESGFTITAAGADHLSITLDRTPHA